MLWLGGAPGAGKSTIARLLSRRHDLPLHAIDLWTYDHRDRLTAQPDLEPDLEPDLDADLARGPAYAAHAFVRAGRARLPLVVADVASRGSVVPVLVEGPQLWPADVASYDVCASAWLLPDPALTRAAREQRLAAAPTEAARARLAGLLARDAEVTGLLRAAAVRAGVSVVDVPAEPDWPAVVATVADALGPAGLPGLAEGEPLASARRYENLVACRQGRAWQADAGLAALPAFPFACECGRSGCADVVALTPDDYDARVAADGHLVARPADLR